MECLDNHGFAIRVASRMIRAFVTNQTTDLSFVILQVGQPIGPALLLTVGNTFIRLGRKRFGHARAYESRRSISDAAFETRRLKHGVC